MSEEYTSNQEPLEEQVPQEGVEPEQESQPEGPSPEEREAKLRAEFEDREAQYRELLRSAMSSGYSSAAPQQQGYGPEQEQSETLDPDEIDWDDPRAVKKAFKAQGEMFKAQIEQAKNEVGQSYSSNQHQMYAQFANIQKDKTYESLRSVGKSDVIKDVEKYIKDNGVTPQQLASPGAYETIAAVVIGEQALKQAQYSSRRAPNLASGGRTGPSSGEDLPKYAPEDLDYVRDRLGDVPEERLDFFGSDQPVSIDQYRTKFRKAN